MSIVSINSRAQESDISRKVKVYIDSSKANKNDSLLAFKFANLAELEAKKMNLPTDLAYAYYAQATVHNRYRQYSKAIDYYDKAIEKFDDQKRPYEVAELLRKSGRIYYNLGDYKTAMKRYLKGLSIHEKHGLTNDSKAWILRYIGSVFKRQENYPKALEYYQKSYDAFNGLEDFDGMSSSMNNIGVVYGNMNKDSLEMANYTKALELATLAGSNGRISLILDNIGSVYTRKGEYKKARSCFDKSYNILSKETIPNYNATSANRQYIADLYIQKNQLDSAEIFLKEAEMLILKTEKKKFLELSDIYSLFSELYFKKKDFEKAYTFELMHNEIEALIHNSEIAAEIELLELAHDRDKLEQKLLAKKKLEEIKSNNQKAWIILLIIGSVILTLFIVIVLFQKRKLSYAYDELAESMEKEKQLGKLKTLFVATASHQFRTPLTVIKSSMALFDLVKDEIPENSRPKFEVLTNRVSSQVDHMTILMDQVMILSKINSGIIKAELKDTDLVSLCEKICSDIQMTLDDKRKTKLIVNGERNYLKLDGNLLEHAISNILTNAFKYSEGSPDPVTTINFKDSSVEISIRDHGIGIPEKDLKHLFEPFYRASNVSEIRGSGLGTAIAKEFLGMMNGTISVKSQKDIGSEFIISLRNSA